MHVMSDSGLPCPLPDLENGVYSSTATVVFEGSLRVTCNAGYEVEGVGGSSYIMTCQHNQTFDVSYRCIGMAL